MRVNHHNPLSLLAATQSNSKTNSATHFRQTGARQEPNSTSSVTTAPTAKVLKIDLTSLASADATAASTSETAPAGASPKFEIPEGATLQGLMDSWGEASSKYDFTQDGQVNVDDLMAMINNWRPSFGEATPETPVDPIVTSADVDAVEINPLLPTSNGDVVAAVPVDESAETISGAGELDEMTPVAANPIEPAPASTGPQASDTNSRPTLDGLLGAWGQENSAYDLNSDGTVNVDDLLMMLNNWPGQSGLTPEFAQEAFENAEPPRRGDRSASANGTLQQLAERISTRLSAEGFGEQPPINLRELVAQLNLSPKQTDFVMKQMQAKYPKGLGVSAIA